MKQLVILLLVSILLSACGGSGDSQPSSQPTQTKKTQEESKALISIFLSSEQEKSHQLFSEKLPQILASSQEKAIACINVANEIKLYSGIFPANIDTYLSSVSKIYTIDYASEIDVFKSYQAKEEQWYFDLYKKECGDTVVIYTNKSLLIKSDISINWIKAYNSLITNS
jgi:hypothetical protein